jgi:hypothetical protein
LVLGILKSCSWKKEDERWKREDWGRMHASCTGFIFPLTRVSTHPTPRLPRYQLISHQDYLFNKLTAPVASAASCLSKTNHVNPPPNSLLYPYHPQIPQLPDHPRKPSNPFLPILPNLHHGLQLRSWPISIVHMIHPMSRLNLFLLYLFLLPSCLFISISFFLSKEGGMNGEDGANGWDRAEEGGDIPDAASNTFNAI